mmetsp:Transcript_23349/g.65139  ORF Transcript_23349/g.65139 Transcript_23349/m.65139 type:complete len:144 (-) Transcript_23349:2041-2472(-)
MGWYSSLADNRDRRYQHNTCGNTIFQHFCNCNACAHGDKRPTPCIRSCFKYGGGSHADTNVTIWEPLWPVALSNAVQRKRKHKCKHKQAAWSGAMPLWLQSISAVRLFEILHVLIIWSSRNAASRNIHIWRTNNAASRNVHVL